MKRHGGLWEHLTSFPNLLRAAHKAARGKRRRPDVARFLFDLERQLCRLQDELCNRTYTPGGYRTSTDGPGVPRWSPRRCPGRPCAGQPKQQESRGGW